MRLQTVLSISDDCRKDDKIFFLIFKFTKDALSNTDSHSREGRAGEEYQSIAFLGSHRIRFHPEQFSLFLCKCRSRISALIFQDIFLHVKNRKSSRKKNTRRQEKQKISRIQFQLVGNRLDNKSSSKCLDGSIKNTSFPFMKFIEWKICLPLENLSLSSFCVCGFQLWWLFCDASEKKRSRRGLARRRSSWVRRVE